MCWVWSAFGGVTVKYNNNNGVRGLGREREAASRVVSERRSFLGEIKEANGFITGVTDYVNQLTISR